jgi:tetratricopeptide (TPR) repeat protein
MWAMAAKNHKKALKCATVLENPRGQCASVGNLGFLLYKRKKYEAAKACMIRYLQICRVIYFVPGIARAHFYLGDIETQLKRYKTALVEFEDALVAAKECKDTTIQTLCKVQIGICKGSLALEDLAENVEAQSIFVNTEEE